MTWPTFWLTITVTLVAVASLVYMSTKGNNDDR